MTNVKGEYYISDIRPGKYILIVSCLGYRTFEEEVLIKKDLIDFNIDMEVLSLGLKEIVVTATEQKENGTSSIIKSDAIQHLQPSSFSDLLSLIPGGRSFDPDFSKVNTISLRQCSNEYNTSLGTSFSIDGSPISNNANFQNIIGESINLASVNYNASITNKGVDMRKISTDDIEKIQIIRGIPSVIYGDITSGVVIIDRIHKPIKLKIRFKGDPGSKLLYVAKGGAFNSGILNMSCSYLHSNKDPRNLLQSYSRITYSVRYFSIIDKDKYQIKFSTNVDYTGSFSLNKRDIDASRSKIDSYSSIDHGLNLSTKSSLLYKKEKFFRKIELKTTINYSNNTIKRSNQVYASRPIPLPSVNDGRREAIFLPLVYQSNLEIDNQPLFMFLQLNTYYDVSLWNMANKILLGTEFKYDKNIGDGEIFNKHFPPNPKRAYRPRPFNSIPAMQKLSFYLEDKLEMKIFSNTLNLIAGVRTNRLLGINSKYSISGKLFFDPRFNIRWSFAKHYVCKKPCYVSLNFGLGWQSKLPTLSHLYPGYHYWDFLELNYYAPKKENRTMWMYTTSANLCNYDLQPAINKKKEIGLNVSWNKFTFSITAFYEKLSSGFENRERYKRIISRKYDNSSIDLNKGIVKLKPEDFSYELDTMLYTYSQYANVNIVKKRGLEYQISSPRIQALKTRITINGAWLYSVIITNGESYKGRTEIFNGQRYPYVGVYNLNRSLIESKFNTNLMFDTYFENFGLIFSVAVEALWFTTKQNGKQNGMPLYYLNKQGVKYQYTEQHKKDDYLKLLYKKYQDDFTAKNRIPIDLAVNIKISKIFKNNIRLACFANSLFNYLPQYTENNIRVRRTRKIPYFGMELMLKI